MDFGAQMLHPKNETGVLIFKFEGYLINCPSSCLTDRPVLDKKNFFQSLQFFPFASFMKFLAVVFIIAFALSQQENNRGHLVLNGGGDKPSSVMNTFIKLSGGQSSLLLIIPTASEDRSTNEYYKKLFQSEYNCTNVIGLEIWNRSDAFRPDYVELVNKAGGIWFGGGDQKRIIQILSQTPVLNAIKTRYFQHRLTVGGTSAGTACQTTQMITGNGKLNVIKRNNIELWEGIGLFNGAIIDQHFIARQRQNRLISVILEHPSKIGVGVDEATAIVVYPNDTFSVVGEQWVQIYDASQSQIRNGRNGNLGVFNLRVHVLQPGDSFDLKRRQVIPRLNSL